MKSCTFWFRTRSEKTFNGRGLLTTKTIPDKGCGKNREGVGPNFGNSQGKIRRKDDWREKLRSTILGGEAEEMIV